MIKLFLSIFLICSLFSSVAQASDQNTFDKAEQEAQKVIDACWAISQEDRNSIDNSRARKGILNSALCMRDHIIYLSETVLFKGDSETQQEVEDSLQKIKVGTGQLYWHLNNNHKRCTKSFCGTMYYSSHNSTTARAMENILKDFYRKIAEYNDDYHTFTNPIPKPEK